MGCIKNLKRKSDHFIFNDILLNWHFSAFSCIFLYAIYLDHCHPLIPLPHSSGISTSTFMPPFFWPRDSNKSCPNAHRCGSSTSKWATYQWPHTWRRPPHHPYQPSTANSALPRKGIQEPLSSPCWVADWRDLGHVLSGSPLLLYMSSEGSSQVMSRRQHFVTLCNSFRLLCSFITLLQLCSVVVGYKNIDCRTEHSIVTILSTLTI